MKESEAIKQFQDLVKQMNSVKMYYDRNFMFHPQSFYNQYMSRHMGPLFDRASYLMKYIPEEKLETLQVEGKVWTGEDATISLPIWMHLFDTWDNLSR